MKKPLLILLVLALVAGGWFAYRFTRPALDRDALLVSGNIEATDTQLGFKISGRLLKRVAEEGQRISQGQLVAVLERTDQEQAVDRARANLRYAQAVLLELEHGTRAQEIADARASVDRAAANVVSAQAVLTQAQADHRRYAALVKDGVVARRDYETFKTALDTASSAVDQAKAAERSTREQLSLKLEGPRSEQIDQAKAQVLVAAENLRQAEQQLEYTNLYAPYAGVVLSKSAEPGAYLNAGSPVLTLGQLDTVWLRGYVNETLLGRLKLGQEARVRIDSRPDKEYPGRLGFISAEAEFTPKSVQTPDERVKLVYRIKIDLDNPNLELKPGMPADARLRFEAKQ